MSPACSIVFEDLALSEGLPQLYEPIDRQNLHLCYLIGENLEGPHMRDNLLSLSFVQRQSVRFKLRRKHCHVTRVPPARRRGGVGLQKERRLVCKQGFCSPSAT